MRPSWPRAARMVIEGFRVARFQPIPSLSLAALAGLVSLATLTTVGQTISQERSIVQAFEQSGVREFSVEDLRGTFNISSEAVERIRRLSHVDVVLGLGQTVDVRVVGLGARPPVGARAVVGDAPELLISGDGGALVSAQSQQLLGLDAAVGAVRGPTGKEVPIVGTFDATASLSYLGSYVLLRPPPAGTSLRRVLIRVDEPSNVEAMVPVVLAILGARPSDLAVTLPSELQRAREVVSGRVGRFSRLIVVGVLTVGGTIGGLAVYMHTTSRRRDYGRRRALGARRSDVALTVVSSVVISSMPGLAVGTTLGVWLVQRGPKGNIGWQFPLAIDLLIVLAMTLAALPAAIITARRDPLLVLRVP